MERYAWIARLRPGKLDEYVRLHDALWPEMTQMLSEAGIRNYTIWTDGVSLFGYYECDSVEQAARVQRESEVNARWSQMMRDYLIAEPDPVTGAQPQLRQVFLHP